MWWWWLCQTKFFNHIWRHVFMFGVVPVPIEKELLIVLYVGNDCGKILILLFKISFPPRKSWGNVFLTFFSFIEACVQKNFWTYFLNFFCQDEKETWGWDENFSWLHGMVFLYNYCNFKLSSYLLLVRFTRFYFYFSDT
jgi:hypothetical protein